MTELRQENKQCSEFFTLLALCHTVMSEQKDGMLNSVYEVRHPFIPKITEYKTLNYNSYTQWCTTSSRTASVLLTHIENM